MLSSHQGAYRHGKSTEDILLVAVDAIIHHIDKNESVCAAFLDLRKAFNSLDHCMLLHQLSNLGVAVLRWFREYLSNRTHRVKCHHQFSSWALMKGGIPQGSALGPHELHCHPGLVILLYYCSRLMILLLCVLGQIQLRLRV